MKRLLALFLMLCMLLSLTPGHAAEDVFTVDAPSAAANCADEDYIASSLSTDRSYLRITCDLESEADVTLSITDETGSLVYQRSHNLCSGRFRSEDVYLRLTGSQTTYQVTLLAGDSSYAFPLRRVMPRLTGNAACSVGIPLSSLTGADTWKSATVLDVNALSNAPCTVALHASGAYEIGTVTFSVSGGLLTVSAQLDASINASIEKSTVYVATTALEAQQLGRKSFHGPTGRLDSPIDLLAAPYVAVYVSLTVSFDPSAPASPDVLLPGQEDLWLLMQTVTANEALG